MQPLRREFKNTPTSAPLARSPVSGGLNRDESLGAHGKVLICNNPEVDQHQLQTGGLKVKVFVFKKMSSLRGLVFFLFSFLKKSENTTCLSL